MQDKSTISSITQTYSSESKTFTKVLGNVINNVELAIDIANTLNKESKFRQLSYNVLTVTLDSTDKRAKNKKATQEEAEAFIAYVLKNEINSIVDMQPDSHSTR